MDCYRVIKYIHSVPLAGLLPGYKYIYSISLVELLPGYKYIHSIPIAFRLFGNSRLPPKLTFRNCRTPNPPKIGGKRLANGPAGKIANLAEKIVPRRRGPTPRFFNTHGLSSGFILCIPFFLVLNDQHRHPCMQCSHDVYLSPGFILCIPFFLVLNDQRTCLRASSNRLCISLATRSSTPILRSTRSSRSLIRLWRDVTSRHVTWLNAG